MGFWDALGKVVSSVVEQGAKAQAQSQRRMASQLNEYEKKIAEAENSSNMSNLEYARKVQEAKQKLTNTKMKMYAGEDSSESSSRIINTNFKGEVIIADKTINEWESRWTSLGILSSLSINDLSRYNHSIGLYKAEMNGKVYYIGRAIEYDNGGFRKRLRDYVRDSDSARTHRSGGKMNENADMINISILVMGENEDDVEAVKALEKALVMKYAPPWNVQFNRL